MSTVRCLLLACLVSWWGAAAAQSPGEPLVAWEFNTAGDAEGWWPAHSVAPLQVADGLLRVEGTGGDPYLCSSPEKPFAVEASDYQYVEIRLKCQVGKVAEFFWAGLEDGNPYGYTGGKECRFSTIPDGQFHVYRVFPLWTGRITQLRFDPMDDDRLEVDYIRIYQLPWRPPGEAPDSWEFNEAGNPDGLIPVADLALPEVAAGHASFTVTGPRPVLITSPTRLAATACRYVALSLSATADTTIRVSCNDDGTSAFAPASSVSASIPGDGRLHTVNLRCAASPQWKGEVPRLRLEFDTTPGATVVLDYLRCRAEPQGPAELRMRSLRVSPTVALAGEAIRVTATVENAGGEAVPAFAATLEPPTRLTAETHAEQPMASLAPGAEATLQWTLRADDPPPGRTHATLRFTGAPGLSEQSVPIIATAPASQPLAEGGAVRLLRTTCEPPALLLQTRLGRRWVTVARASAPYRLVWSGEEGKQLTFPDAPLPACTIRANYRASRDQGGLDVRLTLRAQRELHLGAFGAPFWLIGDGGAGARQDHALFPGLEYLTTGERSSSALDIAPPDNVRFAPHPNKVTVPVMAIEQAGRTVGLSWDPLQKWDGEQDRPTAVFASPNFLTEGDNHLLSLFVPSIPTYLDENQLASKGGYVLGEGRTLTLSYTLFVRQGDVLAATDAFFRTGATPPPLPPARPEEDTIRLAVRGLEELLWSDQTQGWAGVKGWAATDKAGTAFYLYLASQVLPDDPQAAAWREKAIRIGRPAPSLEMALRIGGVAAALDGLAAGVKDPLGSQSPEGGWGFHPSEDRRMLGGEGETAVGLCAGPAASLLRVALITGDPAALAAGERGLAFMERFDVPRAAQTWEVPVHTPDILASAYAADAYLAGYRATGKPEYLQRAVFWARTGLPFLYDWQAPGTDPVMRYGSIPVFGATFFTGSWFGRLVQWNGLVYAQSLNALSRYDRSLPWSDIARGVVCSGLNQTQDAEGSQGLYPDSYGMMDNSIAWGLMLGPQGLLRPLLTVRGVPVDADTLVARRALGEVHVTSAARVRSAELRAGAFGFVVESPFAEPYYTVAMPVTEPRAVTRDGRALPRADDLDPLPEGWTYLPQHSAVIVKVGGRGTTRVEVSDVRPATPSGG